MALPFKACTSPKSLHTPNPTLSSPSTQPIHPTSGFPAFHLKMADQDHSTDTSTMDSREENSQDSKQEFSEDEETLIARMYSLIGERWSLIAGRIPGRTAEEIEKYWTSRHSQSRE